MNVDSLSVLALFKQTHHVPMLSSHSLDQSVVYADAIESVACLKRKGGTIHYPFESKTLSKPEKPTRIGLQDAP